MKKMIVRLLLPIKKKNDIEGYKENINHDEYWKNVEIKTNATKKVS